MRKILFWLSLFSGGHAMAQKEAASYQAIAGRVKEFYNNSRYERIYDLFSTEMAKALPRSHTMEFFTDVKRRSGKMVSLQFKGYDDSYAWYLTHCETGRLKLFISLDSKRKINGLFIEPDEEGPAAPGRTVTPMMLPFKDTWTVFWGGTTKEQNYHMEHPAQRHAFDFIVTDESGKSYKNNGSTNEEYYAFGKEILAPCAGEVVLSVDGIKDNVPGRTNGIFVTGNTVVIKTPQNEYLVFAHFKKYSILVKEGQQVDKGTVLGLCGNSGNSTEPHLHFHVQHRESFETAEGIRCFFHNIKVNGIMKQDYSPVKNDRIANAW